MEVASTSPGVAVSHTKGRHVAGATRPPVTRRRTVGLAFALAVMIAGTAAAAWLASGGGYGSASTGTTAAVELTPGLPSAQLFPGGSADVLLTITNPNGWAVTVPSLRLDTSQGAGGFTASAGCPADDLSFAAQTNGGAGWTVPGKAGETAGTLAVTLSQALAMSSSAENGCQGATFTVYLAAGA